MGLAQLQTVMVVVINCHKRNSIRSLQWLMNRMAWRPDESTNRKKTLNCRTRWSGRRHYSYYCYHHGHHHQQQWEEMPSFLNNFRWRRGIFFSFSATQKKRLVAVLKEWDCVWLRRVRARQEGVENGTESHQREVGIAAYIYTSILLWFYFSFATFSNGTFWSRWCNCMILRNESRKRENELNDLFSYEIKYWKNKTKQKVITFGDSSVWACSYYNHMRRCF